MLEYEPEKFPQSMRQGPKIAIPLRPPSSLHWNIESDLMFTITVDTNRRRLEAKRAAQDPEWESAGAEESPRETPAPEGASLATAHSSQAASPTETTRQEEKDLEVALGAIECIHALRLQTIYDMACVQEIEQAAIHTLMVEFARLHAILCEDLTKSLSALCSELETSSKALSADILNVLNLRPGDPGFSRVRELIQKHHQSVSMKVNLPLIELEAAKEDLNRFLQECLRELGSDPQAREVLEEVTQKLMSYNSRVHETILATPGMERLGVFNQIMLALAVEQPMEAVLLPGILDGLSGRLGMMASGVVDPPTSAREGVSQQWAAALREAVMTTEGREANPDQITPHEVHPALHQDYELDFHLQRVNDIAPTLTSPMLVGIASSICFTERLVMLEGPEPPKTEEGLQGHAGAPAQPAVPGPSHIGGPMETEGEDPLEAETIDLDITIPAELPEDAADIILDDEVISFPGDYPEAVSTPKVEVASSHKRSSEDTSLRSSPLKKWATEETEESPSPQDLSLPRGMKEKDLLPRRYEVFASDYEWVQSVRGSLLGLEAGDSPSRREIEESNRFRLRTAVSETEPPEVVAEHWLPNLRKDGLLVECPLDQFTAPVDWIPLYTREGLQKYLLAALSAFPSQGVPSLVAVVPPEVHVGSDKEFLLCNFHRHGCLVRQSFNLKGRHRQLAYCPYCGVINENSDMALSHVRKHLDLQFVCGGCFSRSFLNGPALNKRMRTCASVTAIRDHSKR